MALQSIEDWNKFLGPPQLVSNKTNEPPLRLDRKAASKAALSGDHWHDNMLKLVGSWIAKGNTEEEIHDLAESHTLSGYTVEQTRHEIQTMIDGAKRKGFGLVIGNQRQAHGVIHQDTIYMNSHNQLLLLGPKGSKKKDTRLTNFFAEIALETTKVDGRDSLKTFSVKGQLSDGKPLPEVEVNAADFDRLDWVLNHWGAKAQITVGPKHKEHTVAAIKFCSKPVERTIYQHTGWITEGGKHTYLSASGGIGANGRNDAIETELQGILASYDLPPPSEKGAFDFNIAMDQFEDLIEGGIGLLLLGSVFRSVLSEFEPCTVSVYLQGTTGTFKSAIAGCLQAFFGKNFQGSHLPENWSSTGNAIEKKAFLAKDTLFTVDDFVARGTPSEVSRLHGAAERVLRAQGNQSGRDRLTSTTQIRGAYVPRGLILATGEDIPNGHSLQARCAILSIERGATDTRILTDLQVSADLGQFSQTMSDFIRWTAEKADKKDIARLLSEAHSECKEQLANNGHTRMRDNLATLLSGLWLLLEFGKERAILSDQKIQHCKAKAKNAAHNLANFQVIVDKEASEAERFIQLLQSVLVMGRAHVADKLGNMPDHYLALGWKVIGAGEHQRAEGQGSKIGWVFDDCIHLDPKAAVSVIRSLSSSNGNYLGSTERTLAKALREANMLAKCDADRNLTKTSVEGRRTYLLCLRLDLVIEQDGPPPKSPILDCSGDDIPF